MGPITGQQVVSDQHWPEEVVPLQLHDHRHKMRQPAPVAAVNDLARAAVHLPALAYHNDRIARKA